MMSHYSIQFGFQAKFGFCYMMKNLAASQERFLISLDLPLDMNV